MENIIDNLYTAPTKETSGFSIEPGVSNAFGYQMVPSITPYPAPIADLPNLAMAPTPICAKGYQSRSSTMIPQPNTDLIIQQPATESVHPSPMINLPSALPGQMRVVTCTLCGTKFLTNAYTYVDCSNPNCNCRICLLDNCYNGFAKHSRNFAKHQYGQHLKQGNLYQCYSRKSPKPRWQPDVQFDSCNVCGVHWCLVGNCIFETQFSSGVKRHIAFKHRQC